MTMRGEVRHCASTETRPYALLPGAATMRSATSRWNMSTMRAYHGGHGSLSSQPVSSSVATP